MSEQMVKKKIIYIFERRHHYNYDDNMFFIRQFELENYEVEVWSLVYWTFGKDIEEPLNIDITGRGIYIANKAEFDEQMERIKEDKCVFICYPYHAYTSISAYVRKKIVFSGFSFCNLCESPVFDGRARGIEDYKILLLFTEELKYIAYYFKNKLKRKKISYREHLYPLKYKSTYNLVCVEENYKSFPNKLEIFSKRNVLIHSDDYSRKVEKSNGHQWGKKYVVFIDQYITGHSDFKKHGDSFPIASPEEYFKECNDFFERLEREYDCDVLIAAHPKAEYTGSEFGGREIVYGKTMELISEAELVLLMTSTVYGMVCYYEKPLIIISSEQMVDGAMWKSLRGFSDFFGRNILVMKQLTDADHISDFVVSPSSKYKKLVNRLIISEKGIKDKKFYEVMLELFENMFHDEVKYVK